MNHVIEPYRPKSKSEISAEATTDTFSISGNHISNLDEKFSSFTVNVTRQIQEIRSLATGKLWNESNRIQGITVIIIVSLAYQSIYGLTLTI